jgi:hypothetical protein
MTKPIDDALDGVEWAAAEPIDNDGDPNERKPAPDGTKFFNDEMLRKGKEKVRDGKKAEAPKAFTLIDFDDIVVDDDPEYLVAGILPRAAMIVVWGPPKCGKSYLPYDILMHVALGWRYRGRDVEQGPVVYLALEGGKGFAKRIAAFKKKFLGGHKGRVPFYLLTVPVNLVKDHPALINAVRLRLGPNVNPAAIALDTLNRSIEARKAKTST